LAALPDESEKVMPDDEVWPDNVPSPLDEDDEYLLLSMDVEQYGYQQITADNLYRRRDSTYFA